MLNKRPQIVKNETVKSISLPFTGFYNSHIDYDLNEALEDHARFNLEDESREEEFLDFVDGIGGDAYKLFNEKVSKELAEFISDKLNEEFGTTLKFEQVEYHPMTLQNTGDNISANIKVENLPTVEAISEYLGFTEEELFEQLQMLSDSKLKSCSGFISFYEHDLEALKGVTVADWNSPYVELLIDFMVEDFFGDFVGVETSYAEECSSMYGGMLEIFLGCLTEEELDKFNSF